MKTEIIEAYGARIEVSAPGDREIGEVLDALPRAALAGEGAVTPDSRLVLEARESAYAVRDAETERVHPRFEDALDDAVSRLHFEVAVHARECVFLHAGAVCFEGRLLLIPGSTHAGKSTLTMALVEAGAEYYSDEYAPVDREGRIRPYRKRPSIRPGSPVSATLASSSPEPPPRACDLVVGCRYREDAVWAPERLTDGQGALLLVANAVVAQTRPTETARAVASVMRSAVAYRTDRPTAAVAIEGIRALLADLEQPAAAGGPF